MYVLYFIGIGPNPPSRINLDNTSYLNTIENSRTFEVPTAEFDQIGHKEITEEVRNLKNN